VYPGHAGNAKGLCDGMILEYTYGEYVSPIHVTVELVLLPGFTHYIILVDVIQTVMCVDDRSSAFLRQESLCLCCCVRR
jgi:hypothetical protein